VRRPAPIPGGPSAGVAPARLPRAAPRPQPGLLVLQQLMGNRELGRLLAARSGQGDAEQRLQRAPQYAARSSSPPPGLPFASAPATAREGTTTGAVVQRKLSGTREALISMAGTAGFANRLQRSTYAQILTLLGQYEARERALMERASTLDWRIAVGPKAELMTLLGRLSKLVEQWLKDHGTVSADEIQQRKSLGENDEIAGSDTDEERRSHALLMLRARLAEEWRELSRPDYLTRLGWTEERLVSKVEHHFGDALNKLDLVHHLGGEAGLFIADRPYETETTTGRLLGMPAVDPNLGARAVAMSRLSDLLGAGFIPPTDFAVQGRTLNRQGGALPARMLLLGVRQALVRGEQAETLKMAATERGRTDEAASFEDPELQRQLNVLQVIDAIAGQVDRHSRNYLVEAAGGRVTGVHGIDLDMSFPSGLRTVSTSLVATRGFEIEKHNFVGMPEMIDAQLAQRILATSPTAVRGALEHLISEDELDATLARFALVQQRIRAMDRRNVISQWSAHTGRRHDPERSYLGRWREAAIIDALDEQRLAFMETVLAEELDWGGRRGAEMWTFVAREIAHHVVAADLTVEAARAAFPLILHELTTRPEYVAPQIKTTAAMDYWEPCTRGALSLLLEQLFGPAPAPAAGPSRGAARITIGSASRGRHASLGPDVNQQKERELEPGYEHLLAQRPPEESAATSSSTVPAPAPPAAGSASVASNLRSSAGIRIGTSRKGKEKLDEDDVPSSSATPPGRPAKPPLEGLRDSPEAWARVSQWARSTRVLVGENVDFLNAMDLLRGARDEDQLQYAVGHGRTIVLDQLNLDAGQVRTFHAAYADACAVHGPMASRRNAFLEAFAPIELAAERMLAQKLSETRFDPWAVEPTAQAGVAPRSSSGSSGGGAGRARAAPPRQGARRGLGAMLRAWAGEP
jgi:hypothetical protein